MQRTTQRCRGLRLKNCSRQHWLQLTRRPRMTASLTKIRTWLIWARLGDKKCGAPVRRASRRPSPSTEVSPSRNPAVCFGNCYTTLCCTKMTGLPTPCESISKPRNRLLFERSVVLFQHGGPSRDEQTALDRLEPCFSMRSSDPGAAQSDPLVCIRANAARPQRNDAICAACPYDSPTFRLRGSCNTSVAPWCHGRDYSAVRKASTRRASGWVGFASRLTTPLTTHMTPTKLLLRLDPVQSPL